MLQEMRKYAKSWVASIFLGALALSFGVWGIADIFKGSTDTSVATVGSTAISAEAYQQEYNNSLKQQIGPDGKQMTSEQARKAGLPNAVMQSLVSRAALDNTVRKMGLTTNDAVVANEIKGARGFAGPLGGFDHDTFLRAIQARGYTEQQFLEVVRGDISRGQLLNAARAGFTLPAGYVQALFNYLNEVRAADYVIVPATAAGTPPAPTDARLMAFVKAHPQEFSTPEYREIDYGMVAPADVAGQVKATDEQLKQQYELRKFDPHFAYIVPERRDVEQITFTTEADAKAAKAKVDGGTKFEDAAKDAGKPVDQLGSVSKDDLGPRGAAVFALADNGVSDPQKNLSGYVLLHVTKITPGVNKTFEDVKEDIRKDVMTALEQAKLGDISNTYTDANSGGMSVQEAGTKVGMKTGHIAAVDANGLAPDGSKTAAADHPDFLKEIFTQEVGDDGDPFAGKDGVLYVLKVDGQIPPKLKTLDQVRAQATVQWTKQEAAKMLTAKAEALAAQATAQQNLNAAAAAAGTPVMHSGRLTRPQSLDPVPGEELPTLAIMKVFQAKPGSAIAVPGNNGSYVVARVTGVAHRPIPMASLQFVQGAYQLSHQSATDMDPLVAAAARNAQGVKINQANADRVTGGSGGDTGS